VPGPNHQQGKDIRLLVGQDAIEGLDCDFRRIYPGCHLRREEPDGGIIVGAMTGVLESLENTCEIPRILAE
jgi:hypothetical protein